jgi:SAM-dependent methyltransferase
MATLGETAAYGTGPHPKPRHWGEASIDVDLPESALVKMIAHVESTWEKLGLEEPHWSVLTHDQYLAAEIGKNEAAFYETGRASADAMRAAAARCRIDLNALGSCLELGCGVGRVTIWLARVFRNVLAIDISAPHLDRARQAAQRMGCDNVDFQKVGRVDNFDSLPTFDSFFSVIVLQHNPPPVMKRILGTMLAKLNPNGVGYFQIPTHWLGYRFNAAEYLARIVAPTEMEMHVLPQAAIFALIEQHGCSTLEVREDDWTGNPNMVSNTFLVRKRG